MKVAHIILAFKEPAQVERMIRKMAHPQFDFYLHIDKKSQLNDYLYLAEIPNVYFIDDRIKVRWGAFSGLNAAIKSLKFILDRKIDYDFFNILSGQDYPIVSSEFLYNFYSFNKGKTFINARHHSDEWWDEAINFMNKYYFNDFDIKGKHRLEKIANFLLPKRKFPLQMELYGAPGAAYWSISCEVAKFILDFWKSNPRLRRFIKFTWAPDEFVIPTIIMNSSLKQNVITENLHFMVWPKDASRPKILTKDDFNEIRNSGKLYARKFDIKRDEEILDVIDQFAH